jgi:hypothetical protein
MARNTVSVHYATEIAQALLQYDYESVVESVTQGFDQLKLQRIELFSEDPQVPIFTLAQKIGSILNRDHQWQSSPYGGTGKSVEFYSLQAADVITKALGISESEIQNRAYKALTDSTKDTRGTDTTL